MLTVATMIATIGAVVTIVVVGIYSTATIVTNNDCNNWSDIVTRVATTVVKVATALMVLEHPQKQLQRCEVSHRLQCNNFTDVWLHFLLYSFQFQTFEIA
jgi:hypothetical protein